MAKHLLPRLQRMARIPECRVVHWHRALKPTSERLRIDAVRAEHFIVETICALSDQDFVRSVEQQGAWFDVYAVYRDGLGWWKKIGEDEDGIEIISHHAPERGPELTVTGISVDATQMRRDIGRADRP